jgi:hypothetical protein
MTKPNDIFCLGLGFHSDQIGQMGRLKSENELIDGIGLLHTLCISIQNAGLTVGLGVAAVGLSTYTKPQFQKTGLSISSKMINQGAGILWGYPHPFISTNGVVP